MVDPDVAPAVRPSHEVAPTETSDPGVTSPDGQPRAMPTRTEGGGEPAAAVAAPVTPTASAERARTGAHQVGPTVPSPAKPAEEPRDVKPSTAAAAEEAFVATAHSLPAEESASAASGEVATPHVATRASVETDAESRALPQGDAPATQNIAEADRGSAPTTAAVPAEDVPSRAIRAPVKRHSAQKPSRLFRPTSRQQSSSRGQRAVRLSRS